MVFVKMHKTIMSATHFFLVVVATGWGKLERKSIYGQLRWNMWEYELIWYRLVGGGRPAASYYFVIGPGSTSGGAALYIEGCV